MRSELVSEVNSNFVSWTVSYCDSQILAYSKIEFVLGNVDF